MSQEPLVMEDVIARPPEAQAIIRMLLARIAKLDARVSELEARLNKTPRNSSLPPSTEHPHAKPGVAKGKKRSEAGRSTGFGTQTARGSRFVETILTVVETCHRQSRNTFEYLTTAVQAHLDGERPPSLLVEV